MLALLVQATGLLAGFLAFSPEVQERWGISGAWVYPVGDPHDCQLAGPDAAPGYVVRRGVGAGASGRHQGADLTNHVSGGEVRAAASGLVVRAAGKGWNSGYGRHIVVAHRDTNGVLVYTVYAHLAPGSQRVRAGEPVQAGQALARVGMTGRATAPHLHFEVRLPTDPFQRWELARVADPLTYVAARLPSARSDTTWARPYLEWAERAALIPPDAEPNAPVCRSLWWRMIALGFRSPIDNLADDPERLYEDLRAQGLIGPLKSRLPDELIGWDEIVRDVELARSRGMRTGTCPVRLSRRAEDAARELLIDPAFDPQLQSRRRAARSTLARVCLMLAGLADELRSELAEGR